MIKWHELMTGTKNWRQEKADYKQFKARVATLPADYQFVFKAIQDYLWQFADFTGYRMLAAQEDLLILFEDGVTNDQSVYALTGDDVGDFADNIVRAVADTWLDERRQKLNRKVTNYRKR
jgi:DNA-binding ferritin-like protein (Dps family)